MNILLIAGGWSPEREISLSGAQTIKSALEQRGHIVRLFDLNLGFSALAVEAKTCDVAFINLHGEPGEDGLVQAFLSRLNCPYQGATTNGSLLSLHKDVAKALFLEAGINVAAGVTVNYPLDADKINEIESTLTYPLFIKASTGGSSIHLYKADNQSELIEFTNKIIALRYNVLVEEYIQGQELTCGVLDGKALPPILIVPKGEFFDYVNKYSGADGAAEICPAPISAELTAEIQALAEKAHKTLGLEDYSRSDFILTKENKLYILETNTLPGMTENSLVPKEAKAIGMEFYALIERLLELALKKKR